MPGGTNKIDPGDGYLRTLGSTAGASGCARPSEKSDDYRQVENEAATMLRSALSGVCKP